MSYLKFDKSLMINLEQSLHKEMLRTNKSGAYHCTSIVGCNTRKQHGLLVIPIPEMDDKAHVLLSSLDETVIQHDAPFNLGIHQYANNVFNPNGHKYIREFNCDTVPTLIFRVGGVILSKEKVFISHENRILIKYTLLKAHSKTTLRFRPFLAFRNANDLCIENNVINKGHRDVKNGIATCLYHGYPELFMQFNKPVRWIDDGHWYNGIEYFKDRERGIPYKEDLWVPGYFELPIEKGESIIFSASTYECVPDDFENTYVNEVATRTSRTSFYNCLKNSATQFYLKDKSGMYIMAGYPWYNVRARDELIALPGCTLAIGKSEDFEKIMSTFLRALREFIRDGRTHWIIHEIDLPDIPLWVLWALGEYAASEGMEKCRKMFGDDIIFLIDAIRSGRIPNLKIHSSGLLSSNGRHNPVTWMSASINGQPIIPRSGYILEFNALWYDAVCFAAEMFAADHAHDRLVASLNLLAEELKESFLNTFLNDAGYLFDYVDGDEKNVEVRPNLAIAVGMRHSPLDRRQKRKVLDFITRELLTPKGIRSLSPKSYAYRPNYVGGPVEREYAVHQGPARPWLFGFYAHGYLNVFGNSGIGFVERMLIGYEEEMTEGCIGSLSELYDGNPPYSGHGAVSTAKNVGEILRCIRTIINLNKDLSDKNV
ncbi:MAG: 4-alpha-glucanotransferase [Bacteroidales bacterium]|nr:4-alpha-glucanotransferase [Bacteroidales bacterium]